MTVIRWWMTGVLGRTAAVTTACSAAEAKELVRHLNGEARRRREERAQEHRARLQQVEKLDASIRPHGSASRLNPARVYAARSRPQDERPTSPTPRRARSFTQLAHQVYGPPVAGADPLISTSGRGGAR
jgi:hypothetical protein